MYIYMYMYACMCMCVRKARIDPTKARFVIAALT